MKKRNTIASLFRRWRGANWLTRQGVVVGMLAVLLLGSALGGRLLGVFAQASCAPGDKTYVVAFGDTLSGIAARFNTNWQRLATYNHLPNANLIFPGQGMCIPGNGVAPTTGTRQQFVTIARQAALAAGISPDIFERQINQESGFNPTAISPAGALGIAQFEPATAAGLGIDPLNPTQALQGAAGLMSRYVQQFGGDIAKALAAYNAGTGTVQRAVQLGGTNWRAFLPTETQNYIRVILG